MIFVSPEEGSHHLVEPLKRHGLNTIMVKLDWADVEFQGRGDGGIPVSVGIEVKRLNELTSDWDRFAGEQIPKMVKHYDYRYLIYEGEWKQNSKGLLLRRTGAHTFRPLHGQCNATALRKKLYGLPLRAGILPIPTKDEVDTVRNIVDLYRMWTDEDFDKHTSHLVLYQPKGMIEQSEFVQAVGRWPNVGMARARAAEKRFKKVRAAAMAGPAEWAAIETMDGKGKVRKIGMKTAEKIEDFLEGRTN